MKNIIKKFAVTLFALPLVFGSLGSLGQVTAKADYWVGGISQSQYNSNCRRGFTGLQASYRVGSWKIEGWDVTCYNANTKRTTYRDADDMCRFLYGGSGFWLDSSYTYFSGWNCYRKS